MQRRVNPHLRNGYFNPYQLDESIPHFRGAWYTFSFLFYFESIFLLANNEDPDQMSRSAASDLGLHCLPMSQKWDARLIWGKKLRVSVLHTALTFEPPHDKTNKMACAPSEDSDQPGYPPSLISLRCPHEGSLGS